MRWMKLTSCLLIGALAACGDYVPSEKKAVYDPVTQSLIYPHPCPDWSHSASINYDQSVHSNFGCAVENNFAVQLDDPADLLYGRGTGGYDLERSVRTIERYRAGEIPAELTPQQTLDGS